VRCASAGADRPECGICADPAYVATPQEEKKALCECGSGAPRRRALRGPCLCSNSPGGKKRYASAGAERRGGGLCAGPAYVPRKKSSDLRETTVVC
jgi:hypothetical protein